MRRLSRDRNGASIFAERTQKNREFIAACATAGHDVHPVTQAVISLLGIIVFPWEFSAYEIVTKQKLPLLYRSGWPRWKMSGSRRVIELGELIDLLRHAVAHGDIDFDSDSRDPTQVTVAFTSRRDQSKDVNWVGKIAADQLIVFCRCFTSAIRTEVA